MQNEKGITINIVQRLNSQEYNTVKCTFILDIESKDAYAKCQNN
jgi:hypothetical protein